MCHLYETQLKVCIFIAWRHYPYVWELTQTDKKRIKILHWYSKVEYVQHHNRAREDRVKDTGEWLFNHEEYTKWSNSDKSQVLWLHGIPGGF